MFNSTVLRTSASGRFAEPPGGAKRRFSFDSHRLSTENGSISKKFSYLPDEIIRQILCYTDVYKERNGRLMQQIPKDDKRYDILKTIHRIETSHNESHDNIGLKINSIYVLLKINYIPGCNAYLHIRFAEINNIFPTPKSNSVIYRHVIFNSITRKQHSYPYTRN